jgi:hypothetical protein
LPHQPRAACAQRQSHGNLFAPFGAARQQQIRQIRASQEQDQPDYGGQYASETHQWPAHKRTE